MPVIFDIFRFMLGIGFYGLGICWFYLLQIKVKSDFCCINHFIFDTKAGIKVWYQIHLVSFEIMLLDREVFRAKYVFNCKEKCQIFGWYRVKASCRPQLFPFWNLCDVKFFPGRHYCKHHFVEILFTDAAAILGTGQFIRSFRSGAISVDLSVYTDWLQPVKVSLIKAFNSIWLFVL